MATLKQKPQLKEITTPQGMPEDLEALPFPLLFWEKLNQELWANSAFVKTFGTVAQHHFEKEKPVYDLKSRPLHLDLFSNEGRHEGYVLQNKKKEPVHVELKVARFGSEKQNTFIILIEDVSSRIDLQEQLIEAHLALQKNQSALIQSSKLASLGELSSGIAHELNQPLQAILGFSQELTHMEKLSPTGMEFLNDIHHAAGKMREIIRSLRTFAREAGDELVQTSVEHAVFEAEKLMHHQLLQKGIAVEINSSPGLPFILANPIQLEQVIVNLMANARDAIEQTGRKDGKISIALSHTKKTLTLVVKDNGCGMTEETRAKIFDPFFTTKEVGKGTGLGLSISYGILKRFQTEITVDSTLNEGSTFKLTFTIKEKKA